jgi:hypothetical protein
VSTYPATLLVCEGKRCHRQIVVKLEHRRPDAWRAVAVAAGWKREPDGDYCPECLRDEKRRTGNTPAPAEVPEPKPVGESAGWGRKTA